MAMSDLPPELFLCIADWLEVDALNAFCRTCKDLDALLTRYLYRRIIRGDLEWVLNWAIVRRGRVCTVRKLIEYGADVPYYTTAKGALLLQQASFQGHADLVEFMFNRNNTPAKENNTVLFNIAVKNGHVSLIQMLERRGFDMNIMHWPIVTAAGYGHLAIVEYLLPYCLRSAPHHGYIARHHSLYAAVINRHFDVVEYLLKLNTSPNGNPKEFCCLPLIRPAVQHSNREITRLLLDYGAEVTSGDILAIATHGNNESIAIIRLLLDRCPSLHEQLPECLFEILSYVCEQPRLLDFVLSRGADPNYKCCIFGHTPLGLATRNSWQHSVASLLDAGADPDLPCIEGLTPVQLATDPTIKGLLGAASRRINDTKPVTVPEHEDGSQPADEPQQV
ncbi:ankyrin [Aspergillus ellipticus CBS 707.79]|uniref:Ankyrin n=1 Tax=Aspergillus ellipticus CBS 707.79 TaxID=1448320 RepID=A0A319DE70_9EURO|nr:ankyrin [Aspergillus ellipticus CBS 707.79]